MKKENKLKWMIADAKLNRIMNRNKKLGRDVIYVFLDFDGVINVFREPGTPEYEEAISKKTFEFWDEKCICRLNNLAKDFHIEIVISSSWRYAGLAYCIDYLHKAGMDDIPVIDTTEITYEKTRQTEILEYLLAHPYFSGFIVLDDGDMPEFKEKMILTHPMKGWDDEIDVRIRKICTGLLK